MKCPKCKESFNLFSCTGLKVKYCKTCRSVFIKFSELQKLGEKLDLKIPLLNPAEMKPIQVKEEFISCPECGKMMEKVYFSGIAVDKCSDCDSIFFENGELARYFNLFLRKSVGVMDNLKFLELVCDDAVNEKEEFVMQDIEIQSKEKEFSVASINGFAMLFFLFILKISFNNLFHNTNNFYWFCFNILFTKEHIFIKWFLSFWIDSSVKRYQLNSII